MTQNKKRIDHMQKRRAQGLTHKELGEEYGMSRVHAGRLLRKNEEDNRSSAKKKGDCY